MQRNKLAVCLFLLAGGCAMDCAQQPKSTSGAERAVATVQRGTDGLTIEQRNIKDRLRIDNLPGSIKHLYIISAYSGDVLMYSTVRGKVTSSGKRLTPYALAGPASSTFSGGGVQDVPGLGYTTEVLQDDGTYGSSAEYLYWWDEFGRYHQHYVSGGQIVHISDQPIAVSKVIINLSMQK